MNQLRKIAFSIISILFFTSILHAQMAEMQLINHWELSKEDKEEWIPVQTPVTVQNALFKANKIPNPFLGNIEDSLQWIGETNWKYKTSFIIKQQDLQNFQHELVFEGLDTYAEVSLNGKTLFNANNMFRAWHTDIQKLIHSGENKIEIRFISPSNYVKTLNKGIDIGLPGGERAWTRKAQYQFGWDWAPTYKTMGIWKPVYINRWKNAIISDMEISYQLDKSYANITLDGIFKVNNPGLYTIKITIGSTEYIEKIDLEKDTERISTNIILKNVELWWPNGMGDHTVYIATLKLLKDERVIDKVVKRVGFRTIEVVTEKDSIGESMYFKVNGKPMYAKGANYIPPSSFPDEIKNTKILELIKDAQECNFNMLRVWGGGYYESDEFYSLCDYAGILVWQDFMFACAMYPGEDSFIQNVREEIKENIFRIGWHPSLAVWCGNNEISEGWERWGWKDGLSKQQKDYLDKAYNDIFKSLLSKEVGHSNQNINYLESSPLWGRGDKRFKTEGDAHDWWVWHDAKPFEEYEENVPRFMSEFGFQSYPDMKTIQDFAGTNVHLEDKVLNAHQKHKRGNELIQTYMDREYPKPKDFESFVYLSQRLQAEGIGKGIIAQRLSMPYCMGSLYWQYNDCWPAISWSSVDYYGRWKALQYKVKRLYAPVLVASRIKGEKAEIHIVSDNTQMQKSQLTTQIYTLNGGLIPVKSNMLEVKPNSSAVYQNIDLKEHIDKYGKENLCIYSSLKDSAGLIISEEIKFLSAPKDLHLTKNALKIDIEKKKYGYVINLKASAVVPGIWISSSLEGKFSDNGFDMVPGEREIKFYTDTNDVSKVEFTVKTLRDAWE